MTVMPAAAFAVMTPGAVTAPALFWAAVRLMSPFAWRMPVTKTGESLCSVNVEGWYCVPEPPIVTLSVTPDLGRPPANCTAIGSAVPPPAYERLTVSRSLALSAPVMFTWMSWVRATCWITLDVVLLKSCRSAVPATFSTRSVRLEPVGGAV